MFVFLFYDDASVLMIKLLYAYVDFKHYMGIIYTEKKRSKNYTLFVVQIIAILLW